MTCEHFNTESKQKSCSELNGLAQDFQWLIVGQLVNCHDPSTPRGSWLRRIHVRDHRSNANLRDSRTLTEINES